jgi:hypothetical protein
MLYLFPEHNLGLFVSYNGSAGALALSELLDAFLDRYFPGSETPLSQAPEDFQRRARKLTGFYLYAGSHRITPEKLDALVEAIEVTTTGDGTLKTATRDAVTQWVEVEPLVFRDVVTENILIFHKDKQQRIKYMFFGDWTDPFVKLPWHKTPPLHWGFLLVCVVVFVSAAFVEPIGIVVGRKKGQSRPVLSHLARLLALGLSLLNLVFIISIYFVMNSEEMFFGVPPIIYFLLVIPLLTVVLLLGLVIFSVLVWKKHIWSVPGRLHYNLITIVMIFYIAWLGYWNLLGYQF